MGFPIYLEHLLDRFDDFKDIKGLDLLWKLGFQPFNGRSFNKKFNKDLINRFSEEEEGVIFHFLEEVTDAFLESPNIVVPVLKDIFSSDTGILEAITTPPNTLSESYIVWIGKIDKLNPTGDLVSLPPFSPVSVLANPNVCLVDDNKGDVPSFGNSKDVLPSITRDCNLNKVYRTSDNISATIPSKTWAAIATNNKHKFELRYKNPTFGQGNRKIILPKGTSVQGEERWSNTLVRYSMGKKVPYNIISSRMITLWSCYRILEVVISKEMYFY